MQHIHILRKKAPFAPNPSFLGIVEMGSAGIDDSSQKTIEPELVNIGNKLLRRPSSTDDLLMLLDEAETLLAKVWQQPPRSTSKALLQIMKALMTDEVLHNDDLNVQIAVASCCNELTRITAPEFPYEDDIMREIFQLYMIAFEQLSCESGRNYYRALHIVETVAKVRSFLILLDVDTDGLVVEMFRLFLNKIGSKNSSDVFKYMEMIMTMVIEESDEISFNLLRPLLASVEMKNRDILPISWELGNKVFENCATKLQRYLKEAVKAMSLEFDDYAEIVACICRETYNDNDMVSKEVSPAAGVASQTDRISKAVKDICSLQTDDDTGALRKRRRKPSPALRPKEVEHTLGTGDSYSHEGSPGYNVEKKDLALMSERGHSSMLSNSLRKKKDSFSEPSLAKNGQSHKKNVNQHKDLEFTSTMKSKILKMKERGDDAPKKTGKRVIAGSSKMRVEKKGGVIGDTSKEEKHHLSPQMQGSPMSKPAKANLEKDKKSRKPRVDFGEELISLRIQVWWPMDEMFYPGTVKAFDPETKKHEILYDDDEIELLNLRKEKWKLFHDEQSPQKQVTGHSSPSRELTKTKENKRRKADTLKKQQQHAASSSKRLKGENHALSKSKDTTTSPDFHQVVAEFDEETCETNISAMDGGENLVSKEGSEISIKKMKGSHIQEMHEVINLDDGS
ncbi:sister chromatid cohesion protein PDS5 homolog C-like isoform X2 [Salvia hispanica]|uniref:sister chromatid cohesion protein PDS5 homolog C-like isoform X2 n=1 Tax=Salvia hispanica TaxID=49212 RepID=UPI0020096598|nr:sister chromatid cohesion protein PDS5 homolog C-like isoform X2 [Salvia hispanica]